MEYKYYLKWLLNELSFAKSDKLKADSIEFIGEKESGSEVSFEIKVTDLAAIAFLRIDELEHALEQVITLAERDSHFGKSRSDIAERAKESRSLNLTGIIQKAKVDSSPFNFKHLMGDSYKVLNQNGFNNALYDFIGCVENGTDNSYTKEDIRRAVVKDNYPTHYPCQISITNQMFECFRIYVDIN